VVAAAVATAAVFACQPQPGLGSIALRRRGALHVIDLATCRDRITHPPTQREVRFGPGGRVLLARFEGPRVSPHGTWKAEVRATGKGKTAKETIWLRARRGGRAHAVFSETEYYKTIGPGETPGPIMLVGWSGDDRWLFFSIDPGGSGSIADDGLTLRVVSVHGGRVSHIARMLLYRDYLSWCGGHLVLTAGIDRIATNGKRLLIADPPNWRPRPLVAAPGRVWGSLTCAPNGRSLVAQSQPESTNAIFFATKWALWQVGLAGSQTRLTTPPRGFADESPRFSHDGRTLVFVRSRKGIGRLFAFRGRRLFGPVLSLGYNLGFYGHKDWWLNADWSAGR
jgi:Tol biopolymer transport system component